jgi:PUB domain
MTYDTPVQQTTATHTTATTASSDTVAAAVKADESEGRLSGNKEWIAARNENGRNVQSVEHVTRQGGLGGGSCATAPYTIANNTTIAGDDTTTAAVDVTAVTVGTVCAVPCAQLLLSAPAESQNSVLQAVLRHCAQQQQHSTALAAVDSFSYSVGSALVLLNISISNSGTVSAPQWGTVSAPQWGTVQFSTTAVTLVTPVEVAKLAPLLTDSNAVKRAVHAVMTHALQRSSSSSTATAAAAAAAAAAAVKALATAKKYAQNVAANAADPRFVRIRLANAVYNRSIGCVRGGAELMLALGFAMQHDSGELYYVHDGAAAAVLHARVASLSDAAAVADSAVQALSLSLVAA